MGGDGVAKRPATWPQCFVQNIALIRETTMSDKLEDQLDLALNARRQRRRQYEAEQADSQKAREDARAELEWRQGQFCTIIRSLIQKAVDRANRHLARRPEKCELCEVSGHFTGPLYVGGWGCNPVAYELRVEGQKLGETLIIELTRDGTIESFLGPFGQPAVSEGHIVRLEFGWEAVPLGSFDAATAADLLLRYFVAITSRWPLGRRRVGA
jgi:hypothetical protein